MVIARITLRVQYRVLAEMKPAHMPTTSRRSRIEACRTFLRAKTKCLRATPRCYQDSLRRLAAYIPVLTCSFLSLIFADELLDGLVVGHDARSIIAPVGGDRVGAVLRQPVEHDAGPAPRQLVTRKASHTVARHAAGANDFEIPALDLHSACSNLAIHASSDACVMRVALPILIPLISPLRISLNSIVLPMRSCSAASAGVSSCGDLSGGGCIGWVLRLLG